MESMEDGVSDMTEMGESVSGAGLETQSCVKCWELNSIGARGNIKEGLEVNSNEFLRH